MQEEKGWFDRLMEFVTSETMQQLKALAYDLVKTYAQEKVYDMLLEKAESMVDDKIDQFKNSDSKISIAIGYGSDWFIKPLIMDKVRSLLDEFRAEQGWVHN